jgi:hypothetical protein
MGTCSVSKVGPGYFCTMQVAQNQVSDQARNYEQVNQLCALWWHGESPSARELKAKWYGRAPFRPEDRDSIPFSATSPEMRRLAKLQAHVRTESDLEVEATRLSKLYNSMWCHHLNNDDVMALVEAGRLVALTHNYVAGKGWIRKADFTVPSAVEVNMWSSSGFGHDDLNQYIVCKAELLRLGLPYECEHCKGHGTSLVSWRERCHVLNSR